MREHTMYGSAIKDFRILVLSSVIYYWRAAANHLKYRLYLKHPLILKKPIETMG